MSNKSGTSSQVISLPKGGGALHGIGEKFAPDLHTGTGNFTVPIALPPGRNGFQPQLNLVYSTGNGNGTFGLGWSLSVPGVSRKTSKGVPEYDDAVDTFILSGAEDLVPVPGEPNGPPRYRPRTEGLFARIERHLDAKNDFWEVRSKDGLTSRYGTLEARGEDSAVIAKLSNPQHIFAWKLTQTRDPFGNLIQYEYEADAGDDGVHAWRQPLLKRICYVDYGDAAKPDFLVTVTFVYEDEERPDPFSDYRAGFEIRTTKRCTKITVASGIGRERGERIYHLIYLDQLPEAQQPLSRNGVSLLSQVWVEGRDAGQANLLPNATFKQVGPDGTFTTFTSGVGGQGWRAAAEDWLVWNGQAGTITTELLSAAHSPFGAAMLHVTTTSQGGLVNVFGATDTGPDFVIAAVWVFVVHGQVGIGVGNGGNTHVTVKSATAGTWEYLETPNGVVPANEFIMYAQSDDGAEFYVAYASVAERPIAEWLPPLEFRYTPFEPEQRRNFFPIAGAQVPLASLARPEFELADLTGDGLPDILEMNGTVRYWRNLGGGCFDLPRPMREAPAGLTLADPGVQMIDADGDGRIDLLVTQNGQSGYFPLRYDGQWDRQSFRRYAQAPSFNLRDPEVKLVDLDGDGVTDAIRAGSRLECFFNRPENGGWQRPVPVERQALEVFPNINFSDPRVKWGDMSGDGLQDIVLISNGNVEYWPNLGRGAWGKRISMRRSPRYPYGYDPRRILVGDVDGDGLADIVYVDNTRVTLWINQSGNGWSEPIEITGTPPVTDMDAVRLVDMLGSGVSGILWSADAKGRSRANMYFLDLTGAMKPYLLAEMDNHMGALTKVEYASSTRFYLDDQKDAKTRWRTSLPFPVQVVARVEVIDALSQGKLTTKYCYHHGYWDGAEREFRGFGMVEQFDSESFAADYNTPGLHGEGFPFEQVAERHFSHPTLTRTWFHEGPVGPELGDWQEDLDRSGEFWQGDMPLLDPKEHIDPFLRDLAQKEPRRRRIRRDALRALRGSVLRMELYVLDGTERERRPYTVTESQYSLREEDIPDEAQADRLRIFFPQLAAQRTTQWERGDDPMTQFAFTGDYDAYGQPCRQTQVACPRGWRSLADTPAEGYLATRSRTEYVQETDPTVYIKNRVARATSYELTNTGNQTVLALRDLDAADPNLEIIGQTLNFYDLDETKPNNGAFDRLPFGKLGKYGALVRTDTLVFTDKILEDAYGNDLPPYLNRNRQGNWADGYPLEFANQFRAPNDFAGYIYKPNDNYIEGYYITAERRHYDFHEPAGRVHGLLLAQRGPLGKESRIGYDQYALLPIEVREILDPALRAPNDALVTKAEYDYRVMQPKRVIDPNGNVTEFAFSPLGMLRTTWVKGKNNPLQPEGDHERPSVEMAYDFFAFMRNRQPIFVAITRRVHHDTDLNVPKPERDETIEAREYSDGFGRLLQTRTQGEEVRFGNDIFGGGARVLPANQQDGRGGDVIGRANLDPHNPNVVVSGWQTYDNKGRVVEKYEPFFDVGWAYQPPFEEQFGAKVTMFYDPRGQVSRTLNPNGSEQRVIYGVPGTIVAPDVTRQTVFGEIVFEPTPWEAYTYDANDLAPLSYHPTEKIPDGSSRPLTDRAPVAHHFTPSSIEIDGLGRTILTTVRNGPYLATDWYHTRSTYDIRGNLLVVTDALGRAAFAHTYDLANRPLRIDSIDAGKRWTVFDAAGNILETWDSKGARTLRAYDRLNRPTYLWARHGTGEDITPRERLIYGDDAALALAPEQNLRGKLHQHYDEAGLLTFEAYDFKGNLLEKQRAVISDSAILAKVDDPVNASKTYVVDWDDPPDLEGAYQTSMIYDALGRARSMRYPEDVAGHRAALTPSYNRAGALESVQLDGATYVERIAYNAKGQRTLIAYGNGIMTRYAYDPRTFRLVRMRTERYEVPAGAIETYRPKNVDNSLQDFIYDYDLAGNILRITEVGPGCGVLKNPWAREVPEWEQALLRGDALIRTFTYDPLYRLLSATGRESKTPPGPHPWEDAPRDGFGWGAPGTPSPEDAKNFTQVYTETYAYDPAGNMLSLGHSSSQTLHFGMGGFTPKQWKDKVISFLGGGTPEWGTQGNRLTNAGNEDQIPTHSFDPNGNLKTEFTSRHLAWDYADRMIGFANRSTKASQASVQVCYLYGADGMRVKKWVRTNGTGDGESTVYIDGVFEHHRWKETGQPGKKQNNHLHVMDDQSRIALTRVGDKHSKDSGSDVQYHLGDHLGSSNIVVGSDGALINREEYCPYGETSFGSFAKKRYRFTGKERDDESGLYYHGARYYAPWLARWVSCDPATTDPQMYQAYAYCFNRPLNAIDPDGRNPILIGILILLMLPGNANAPSPEDVKTGNLYPTVTEKEFAVQFTVIYFSGKAGGTVGEIMTGKTGSAILGGAIGGSTAGGLIGVGSVGVNDAFNQQLSPVSRYLYSGGLGLTFGFVIGGVQGSMSGYRPISKSAGAPTALKPGNTGRVVNIGGELEAQTGDIVINPGRAAMPLPQIAQETGAIVIKADVQAIPLRSGVASKVVANKLPANVIDWSKAGPEIGRVLKPGGTVEISSYGPEGPAIAAGLEAGGIKATVDPLSNNRLVTGVKPLPKE